MSIFIYWDVLSYRGEYTWRLTIRIIFNAAGVSEYPVPSGIWQVMHTHLVSNNMYILPVTIFPPSSCI